MASKLKHLSIVIQAGGESKRMGKPKQTVSFLGEPLIMRQINRLSFLTDDLSITTNDPDSLSFLCDTYGRCDIRLIKDKIDVRGALNGIYTALSAAKHEYIGLVACDMVFPSAPLFRREYEIAIEGGYDLVIPKQDHGWEPFHAVYKRDTCLQYVKDQIKYGDNKASSWYKNAKVYPLSREEVLAIDPRGGAFANLNTPQELYDMEQAILHGKIDHIDNWPKKD